MICVSINEPDFSDCLKAASEEEFAEIRMDITPMTDAQLKQLFALPVNLIATFRPGKENEEVRINKLKSAIDAGADYVDIEYETEEYLKHIIINYAKEKECKIILSYHDFEETPSISSLREIIQECFSDGADIVKIATTTCDESENKMLMSLYTEFEKIIVFGMDEIGMSTRVEAMKLGAPFMYASQAAGYETAPGQMTKQELLDKLEE